MPLAIVFVIVVFGPYFAIPYFLPYISVLYAGNAHQQRPDYHPGRYSEKIDLDSGTVLEFDEHADHLHAEVVPEQVPVHKLIGSAGDRGKGKSALKWLEQTRGAVRLPRAGRRR